MNFVLLALTTELSQGFTSLRECVQSLENTTVDRISSICRRVEGQTEGTLSSEMVVVLDLRTDLDFTELQKLVRKLKMRSPGVNVLVLALNHQVYLDPQTPIPHPDLHLDPLILRCAAEIRSDFEHPVLGRSLQELVKSSQSSFQQAQFEFLSRGERLLAPPTETP